MTFTLFSILGHFIFLVSIAISLAAGAAAINAALTRPDAFDAAGRMSKPLWVALLGGATVFSLPLINTGGMLSIVAAVITGVWWFDVRPQIKDLLDNVGY